MGPSTAPRPLYDGWDIIATTCCMALVSMGARSGFGGFVLPMSAECGWHRGTISLAAAIGALVSGLSQSFVGQLYDRLGGRQLILVSLVVSGVCTMLLALTTHILVLIMLFGGVLSIAMGGSSLTGHQLGGALSIQLGSTLGDLTGSYDLPFALAGLLFLVASLAGVTMRERRYSTRYQPAASAAGD